MNVANPFSILLVMFLLIYGRVLFLSNLRNELISVVLIFTSVFIVFMCNISNLISQRYYQIIFSSLYNGFVIACIPITIDTIRVQIRRLREYSK